MHSDKLKIRLALLLDAKRMARRQKAVRDARIYVQARFTVASAPYTGADGYTYVDMVEQAGTLFIS